MLIILLFFALCDTLHSAPVSPLVEDPNGLSALDSRNTQDHFGQRSVNEIIISCFVTIFACTWSAIHPNIPAPTDSVCMRFKRQVTIMIYGLLAPELIISWALNQRIGARKIMDKYNKVLKNSETHSERKFNNKKIPVFSTVREWFEDVFGAIRGVFQDLPFPPALAEGAGPQWTLAHGFFLQMGGFMLCENGQPVQILTAEPTADAETTLIWNIEKGIIDPPRITEEDIKDRSKGDAISKTFVVLHTTWFIVQCIARWSQRLPLTKLEVITLGFAMLNGITYGLWWNKPQNVGRPVFLERKKPLGGSDEVPIEFSNSNTISSIHLDSKPLLLISKPGNANWLRRKLREERERHPYHLHRILFRILQAALRPLRKMAGDQTFIEMRVGMYYTVNNFDWSETGYATALIGALFGSIHLVPGWFLDFSSPLEMWLWRVSTIIITTEPVVLGIGAYFDCLDQWLLSDIFAIFMFIGFPFYFIARIILLTLSLTSLHSLPPPALQTIEWTTFIPHL